MASRLAMFALLLVFAVWGAWPNYVATARVEGEAGKQILLAIFHFQAFLANISYITFSFASLAAKIFAIISAVIYTKDLEGSQLMNREPELHTT